ncbi:MAG TPA: NADH-quinone oxidoreductase subunit NuoH [Actinomycetota bacterium]|jgi:NADH-quinone oxidoreductase subunit H|nr:NADH-quinone oxidoreductase subunit NuoH [Actinomycetota bacterium]
MDWIDVVILIAKTIVVFLLLNILLAIVVWGERKVIADMQSRIGPNRAGPFGILQSIADGVKLLMKEDIRPITADRFVYPIAPIVSAVPAFAAFAVVPFGDKITIAGREIILQLADINVGLLFFLAMGSIAVYGVALAGWSSGSKYPLFGAVRSSAQMISYEIAMGLSVIPVVLYAGTLSTRGIVEAQHDSWFIGAQIPSFVIFLLAGIAETNRAPFDLPEAETELVAGYHTEYSGIKFMMFFMAEYMHIVTISAIAVTLFWGGWNGPVFPILPALWPVFWFLLKTSAFVFLFFWLRASLPRLRYDQLMNVGWKFLIPVGILWIPVSAAARIVDVRRWILFVGGAIIGLVLISLFAPTRAPEDAEEEVSA